MDEDEFKDLFKDLDENAILMEEAARSAILLFRAFKRQGATDVEAALLVAAIIRLEDKPDADDQGHSQP